MYNYVILSRNIYFNNKLELDKKAFMKFILIKFRVC